MKRTYRNATFIVGLVRDTHIAPHGHSLQWKESLLKLYSESAGRGSVNGYHNQAEGQVELRITDPTLTRDIRSGKYSRFIASGPALKIDENAPKI